MVKTKRVVLLQPASAGGNFEYIAIPRQGMLFLSGALAQWEGPHHYEREIWFEDRCGLIDPDKDLDGVDILMVTALINECPRGYQIARLAKEYHPDIVTIGGGPQMGPLPEEAFPKRTLRRHSPTRRRGHHRSALRRVADLPGLPARRLP